MSAEQRRQLLDQPKNYPLRVTFLGKTGLLTHEEMAFLLSHGVDPDIDDRQVADILPELAQPDIEPPIPGVPAMRLPSRYLLPVTVAALATWLLLKRVVRLIFSRQ